MPHARLDDQLAVLLAPHARGRGLVGSGPFNLGVPRNFRVPDRAYHRGNPTGTWVATVALVIEILSPRDETYEKFGFYFDHGVEEILVVDPVTRAVECWHRAGGGFESAQASELLGVTTADVAAQVEWPDAE